MTEKERVIANLRMTRDAIVELLDGFPADQAAHRPSDTDNHALWILGHLAVTDEWIIKKLGEKGQLPAAYDGLFGYQSMVHGSADGYPPFDEVRNQFDAVRQRLLDVFEAADAATLAEPLVDYEGDLLGAPLLLAWHEGWHSGQLSSIRRALGLKPAFG
ncbi:MAG: DinB family protein [Phycisphaerales bacterium]|nr:DinB family protein [Phycisphaerales bacterium]